MGKQLVLAEKPSVGKEIGRVLGCNEKKNGYLEGQKAIVTWAFGHLVELAAPEAYDNRYKNWVLEDLPIIPEKMKTQVIGKSSRQFNVVKSLLNRKDVTEIVIATDAGREGELVARWTIEKAHVKKPIKRLWISSVTDKAIREGFKHLKNGREYENLSSAAKARAESDWIVGINGTRALTTKYNAQLSLGRVQTPTINLVATREESILHFSARKFYGLILHTDAIDLKLKFNGGDQRSFDEDLVDKIQREVEKGEIKIKQVSRKKKKQYSDFLYDLTALQSDAYKRYGYSPKQTLNFMQALYEKHKALTYPRTDSRHLTSDIVDTLGERLEAIRLNPYRKIAFRLKDHIKVSKRFVDDSKVSDHHAIIPTEESVMVSDLDFDERRIYEMVLGRFLEVLMPPAEYEELTLIASISGHTFEGKASCLIERGFREVRVEEEVETKLPNISENQNIRLTGVKKTSGQTSPPSYFNEATLLEAMEKPSKFIAGEAQNLKQILKETGGLGTVATRAEIIDKLFTTKLMEKRGNDIRLTKKGKQLLDLAPEDLKSPLLTAKWEKNLKAIENGKLDREKFIQEMRTYTYQIVDQIKRQKKTFKHDNLSNQKCPDCGKLLMRVDNKHGKSLVCTDRECGYRERLSRVTNARCPQCHKKMELRGPKEKQIFVCSCGYKESMAAFEKRKKERDKQGGKRDYVDYMKKQKKQDEKERMDDNPFAQALKGLDFD
jgi:DNA topoisomerase-3